MTGGVLVHGQGGEGDHRDPGVDPEHRDQHQVDRFGHLLARIAGLLGHVGDGLDPGVGEHRDRDGEDQLREARRGPEVHLVDQHRGMEHQHRAEPDQGNLGEEVEHRKADVQVGRLTQPADVDQGEDRDRRHPADHVARRVTERREERRQVVRDEEGADRDREDVVE